MSDLVRNPEDRCCVAAHIGKQLCTDLILLFLFMVLFGNGIFLFGATFLFTFTLVAW